MWEGGQEQTQDWVTGGRGPVKHAGESPCHPLKRMDAGGSQVPQSLATGE